MKQMRPEQVENPLESDFGFIPHRDSSEVDVLFSYRA